MDKTTRMVDLARRLDHASASGDWVALVGVDAEVAAQLPLWDAMQGWTPLERRALELLRRTHAQAAQRCDAELKRLGGQLEDITRGQGRWQAYAQSTHWEDTL